jgi:hypothetical protein
MKAADGTKIINAATLTDDVEQRIQKLLLELDEKLAEFGQAVESINVDTRNYANLAVTIWTEPRK